MSSGAPADAQPPRAWRQLGGAGRGCGLWFQPSRRRAATITEVYTLHNLLRRHAACRHGEPAAGARPRLRPADRPAQPRSSDWGWRTIAPPCCCCPVWRSICSGEAPAIVRQPPRLAGVAGCAAGAAAALRLSPTACRAGRRRLNGSFANAWAGWDHVLARRYTAFFAANGSRCDSPAGCAFGWRKPAGSALF